MIGRERERTREKGGVGSRVSRVEVCATQAALSRITQTSWTTMEHHDRPSSDASFVRDRRGPADNGGQSRVA